MHNDQPRGGKAKIIAWCVATLAVAIIYIVVTSRGHASDATLSQNSTTTTTPAPGSSGATSSSSTTNAIYKDGTYRANTAYRTPGSVESISVNLTVSDGSVTAAAIEQSGADRDSRAYQDTFQSSYQSFVVGKKLSDINLSRVSGASLTSMAFDQALDHIKSQARG